MSSFKVLQFNMQFGQGWSDVAPDHAPVDIEATIAEIKRHDADLILLQEVERALPGGSQPNPPPNQTRLRAALSNYDSCFALPKPDPRELPFGIGLAIFSRTPLVAPTQVDLPSPPLEFDFYGEKKTPTDRLLIGARTTIHGREIQLFNTHLLAFFMLNSSSEIHNGQRRIVADHLASSDIPTLLGGDFNVRKSDSIVTQFGACGYRTVQTAEITWRRMPFVLDHLFYNRHLRVLNHKVGETSASDHHTLSATFEFV